MPTIAQLINALSTPPKAGGESAWSKQVSLALYTPDIPTPDELLALVGATCSAPTDPLVHALVTHTPHPMSSVNMALRAVTLAGFSQSARAGQSVEFMKALLRRSEAKDPTHITEILLDGMTGADNTDHVQEVWPALCAALSSTPSSKFRQDLVSTMVMWLAKNHEPPMSHHLKNMLWKNCPAGTVEHTLLWSHGIHTDKEWALSVVDSVGEFALTTSLTSMVGSYGHTGTLSDIDVKLMAKMIPRCNLDSVSAAITHWAPRAQQTPQALALMRLMWSRLSELSPATHDKMGTSILCALAARGKDQAMLDLADLLPSTKPRRRAMVAAVGEAGRIHENAPAVMRLLVNDMPPTEAPVLARVLVRTLKNAQWSPNAVACVELLWEHMPTPRHAQRLVASHPEIMQCPAVAAHVEKAALTTHVARTRPSPSKRM